MISTSSTGAIHGIPGTRKVLLNETANSNGPGTVYAKFDASLSNPIYGNSSTVQPPATKTYMLIKY